jgi:hypothetical protein
MSEISIEERNLYRALGELSYIIATTDGRLSNVEKVVFEEALKEELGLNGWLAKDRFNMLLEQNASTEFEATYQRVLFAFRQNKSVLTEVLIEKFIAVLEKVAGVSGITDEEIDTIERFRGDVLKICQS